MLIQSQEEREKVVAELNALPFEKGRLFVAACCERWQYVLSAFFIAHRLTDFEKPFADLLQIYRSDQVITDQQIERYSSYLESVGEACFEPPQTLYAQLAQRITELYTNSLSYCAQKDESKVTLDGCLTPIDETMFCYIERMTGADYIDSRYSGERYEKYKRWLRSIPIKYIEHMEQQRDLELLRQATIVDSDFQMAFQQRKRISVIHPIQQGYLLPNSTITNP